MQLKLKISVALMSLFIPSCHESKDDSVAGRVFQIADTWDNAIVNGDTCIAHKEAKM